MSDQKTELNLTVKSQEGHSVCFKLKLNTSLKKLMDAYCGRINKVTKQVKFIYNGQIIKETDTPGSLEMEEGDEIDAVTQQEGGGF